MRLRSARAGTVVRVGDDQAERLGPGWAPVESMTPPAPDRPAQAAAKAEWVAYIAATTGMSADDAEALKKADLIGMAT